MNNRLKVALNMARLPIAQKILKAQDIIDAVSAHPAFFPNPIPSLSVLNNALANLKQAAQEAMDGGKSRTALMHDAENVLMRLMYNLAHYVEIVAGNNVEIIHSASLSIKKHNSGPGRADFEISQLENSGSVCLRIKPHKKAFYKWQYTTNPKKENSWSTAIITTVSHAVMHSLQAGQNYWFRVVLITVNGEHATEAKSFAVN